MADTLQLENSHAQTLSPEIQKTLMYSLFKKKKADPVYA